MSQIRIYGLKSQFKIYQSELSNAIHRAVVEALTCPVDNKFHRFIGLDQSEFIFPANKSQCYTIIEISMFESRSAEVKRALIKLLFEYIERGVGIDPEDIEITIFDTPKYAWGIGGVSGDELGLSYAAKL